MSFSCFFDIIWSCSNSFYFCLLICCIFSIYSCKHFSISSSFLTFLSNSSISLCFSFWLSFSVVSIVYKFCNSLANICSFLEVLTIGDFESEDANGVMISEIFEGLAGVILFTKTSLGIERCVISGLWSDILGPFYERRKESGSSLSKTPGLAASPPKVTSLEASPCLRNPPFWSESTLRPSSYWTGSGAILAGFEETKVLVEFLWSGALLLILPKHTS